MNLYKQRLLEIKQTEELRRQQKNSSIRNLTQEDKERMAREMQNDAKAIDEEKRKRTNFVEASDDTRKGNAQFLRGVKNDAYMDSGMALEDRLNRN